MGAFLMGTKQETSCGESIKQFEILFNIQNYALEGARIDFKNEVAYLHTKAI